ncbi:MAG: ATP-binding protein [Candidatus Helarchaeota archaeon]
MPNIQDYLIDLNPWWKEEFKVDYKKREIYEILQKFIPLPQIIALTGLRRVGKSTLLLKIAEDAISKNMNPKNILYFSFDEFNKAEIREIINIYEELLKKNLKTENFLFLLDEIQKLDNWENQIKLIYDTFQKRIKIIISGSESLFIKKKSKESLAGRIFEFKIEPLTFQEFLWFKGLKLRPIDLYKKELKKELNEFFLTLGFPELVGINDKLIIKKYVHESIVEKIVYKDIPSSFRIKNVSVLDSLLNLFMEQPGQIVEISELSKELKISRQTLSTYLRYLEESFLIKKIYNYSKSRRKVERKLKKFYPTLISVNLLFKEDEISKSIVFEWFLVNQLKAEYFWRDPYKNEVDIIIPNEYPLPIELKYGKITTKSILTFMKKFNVKDGYIITHDKDSVKKFDNKTIHVIPVYKFLLEEKYVNKYRR